MKKYKLTFFLPLLALAMSFSGCVSKSGVRRPPEIPVPDLQTTTPSPPPETGSPVRSNRIALVVGGTGVASFATVGLLKKFYEEAMEIDFIVATGWPTLFALANGFSKSVHDLEWFATRLEQRDFERVGAVDFRRDIEPSDVLQGIILASFPQTLLNQARVPVIISATNTDLGEPDVFGSGEWKEPLLRTFSVPGVYRKYPMERGIQWIQEIQGLDVREALRRGAPTVVAVSMYDDYLQSLMQKGRGEDELFRKTYAARLRKTIHEAMKQATESATIVLRREPTDFTAKRAAILAGYREATQILKKIRQRPSATAN